MSALRYVSPASSSNDMFESFTLLTAFLAGVFALFAPCCIGFLLPSYLGTIFKERVRVFAFTTVFALGIFAVFLPIGLGMGAVGSWLTRFHDPFFYAGSAMLAVFGLALLVGKMPMLHLPFPQRAGRPATVGAVFVLGIFSGIGSACCAPVFAGVVTLSALSGTMLGGAALAGAYVLGMVAPLFLLSWAIDRSRLLKRFSVLQRPLNWRIGPISGQPILAHVIAGVVFLAGGALVAWLTATGRVMSAVSWRESVQTGWAQTITQRLPWLADAPDALWLAALIVAVGAVAVAARRAFRS